MPPIFDPSYLLSFTSDLYFKSRFVILSLRPTILDDGGGGPTQVFLAPPPPFVYIYYIYIYLERSIQKWVLWI